MPLGDGIALAFVFDEILETTAGQELIFLLLAGTFVDKLDLEARYKEPSKRMPIPVAERKAVMRP